MDQDKKKEIINKYDSTSTFYDDRYSKIQFEKYKLALKTNISSGNLIIDIGCGTGLFFNFLSYLQKNKERPSYLYVGTDISFEMLKVFSSKERREDKKLKCNLNLVLSDIENLPFRNNIFQKTFSFTSIQNLPDIRKGLNEIFRISRINTDIVISILKKTISIDYILNILKNRVKNLETIRIHNLEDIIFIFKLQKKN
ncbi:MAG: class I SAM-dependent methyltransferase [Promethearchaeota archaeon]